MHNLCLISIKLFFTLSPVTERSRVNGTFLLVMHYSPVSNKCPFYAQHCKLPRCNFYQLPAAAKGLTRSGTSGGAIANHCVNVCQSSAVTSDEIFLINGAHGGQSRVSAIFPAYHVCWLYKCGNWNVKQASRATIFTQNSSHMVQIARQLLSIAGVDHKKHSEIVCQIKGEGCAASRTKDCVIVSVAARLVWLVGRHNHTLKCWIVHQLVHGFVPTILHCLGGCGLWVERRRSDPPAPAVSMPQCPLQTAVREVNAYNKYFNT